MTDLRSILSRVVLCAVVCVGVLGASGALAQEAPADAPANAAASTDAAAGQAAQDAAAADDAAAMTQGEALVRKLVEGGWTMFFLALVSIVGVAVAIERALRLKRKGIVPLELADQADRLWRSGQYDALTKLAEQNPSTLGRVLSALVRHRKNTAADVSAIAGDIASRDLRRHLQRAYPLLIVATLSPLLGLLGTVIGMIGAFATIEALGELADPAAFGGDISKALITTGAGLAIAVPALAAYHFFKSRTTGLAVELEEVASEFIAEWFVLGNATHEAGASGASGASGAAVKVVATPQPGAVPPQPGVKPASEGNAS